MEAVTWVDSSLRRHLKRSKVEKYTKIYQKKVLKTKVISSTIFLFIGFSFLTSFRIFNFN